jgi:ketosteroid isomerase-like protein
MAEEQSPGTRNGKMLDITACQLMRIEDGKIVEMRGYYSDQYALDDFWS